MGRGGESTAQPRSRRAAWAAACVGLPAGATALYSCRPPPGRAARRVPLLGAPGGGRPVTTTGVLRTHTPCIYTPGSAPPSYTGSSYMVSPHTFACRQQRSGCMRLAPRNLSTLHSRAPRTLARPTNNNFDNHRTLEPALSTQARPRRRRRGRARPEAPAAAVGAAGAPPAHASASDSLRPYCSAILGHLISTNAALV